MIVIYNFIIIMTSIEMKNKLHTIFPVEITDIILEFHGFHKWSNSSNKYITQIPKDDERYSILSKISPIINIKDNYYHTTFIKFNNIYVIEQRIYGNHVHWYMDVYNIINDKYVENKLKSIHYIKNRIKYIK